MFLLADTLMLDQQGKRPPLILDATSFTCQPKVCKIYEKQTKTARQFGMEVCRVGTVILLIFAVLFSRFFLTDIYILLKKKLLIHLGKDDVFAYGFGTIMFHE